MNKESFICDECNDGLGACILTTETETIPHLCPFIEKEVIWRKL